MASLFPFSCLVTACLYSTLLLSLTSASTDPLDVTALQDLYGALNYPPQLKGWRSKGGDPCEESWIGISCYGSSVIFIQLNGLELSGNLGGQLAKLLNLKQLDVSSNNIQGEIPFSLPPNATHINLACNKFSQYIPFSLTSLKHLHHLNLSHNSLSGPLGNVFTGLQNLRQMINGNKFDFPEFRLMARYNGNESWKLGTLSLLMVVGSMLAILAVVALVGCHQAAEDCKILKVESLLEKDCRSMGGLEKHYHDRHRMFTFSCRDCV